MSFCSFLEAHWRHGWHGGQFCRSDARTPLRRRLAILDWPTPALTHPVAPAPGCQAPPAVEPGPPSRPAHERRSRSCRASGPESMNCRATRPPRPRPASASFAYRRYDRRTPCCRRGSNAACRIADGVCRYYAMRTRSRNLQPTRNRLLELSKGRWLTTRATT